MAYGLQIDGSQFIIYDTVTGEEYIREPKEIVKFTADTSDYFRFYYKVETKNGTHENFILGSSVNNFDGTVLVDERTGIAFPSITVLKTYLNSEIGFFFNPMTSDPTGVISREFLLEVKKGNVIGHKLVEKFGAASAIPTSLTVISSAQTYETPTALTSLELVSDDNTNDIAGGTGALKVQVFGIGTGYAEVSEEITLNGTTAVALSNQYYRIYRMKVIESGQYASPTQSSHNSIITLRVASAGATWATIEKDGSFGLGQSEIGAFTTPAGYTGFLLSKNIGFEASKNASVFMFVRDKIDVVSSPFGAMRSLELDRNINNRIDVIPRGVLAVINEKTDVGFMAKSITGTTALSVDFEILLVENQYLGLYF
jgi:hypothetical protein